MIPILYEKNETSFTSNGLGRLRDCISAVVTEERNSIYELDFEYPVDGVRFDQIYCGRIVGVTHDDDGDIQPFDIVSYSKPIDGKVTFHCVHISYRQSYLTVKTTGTINSLSDAFTGLSNAEPNNPFTYITDKTSSGFLACWDGTPRTVRQILGGIEGSVLDTYGGEYEWDKFNVILHNVRGTIRNFSIRYGVNMTDFKDDTDSQGTYSSVIPYWASGDDKVIGDRVDSTGVPVSGRVECVPLDVSDKFESKPTKAQVEAMAATVLSDTDPYFPTQTISVSFVRLQDLGYEQFADLLKCNLCDEIPVYFPRYKMSQRFKIVKTVWNVLGDRYENMELGQLSTTLSEALGVQTTLSGGSSGSSGPVVTGVKGNAEGSYRQGDVNLTPADIGAEPDITSSTDLTVGSLKIGDHTTAIGSTLSARNTSTVTVNTSTATNITSLSLPKGTWMVCCGLRWPANTTGYRAGKLSSTSANVSTTNGDVIMFAQNMTGTGFQMEWNKIVTVTATSQTWYLEAIQNSGSNLVMPKGSTQTGTNPYGSYIHAVRIA